MPIQRRRHERFINRRFQPTDLAGILPQSPVGTTDIILVSIGRPYRTFTILSVNPWLKPKVNMSFAPMELF